MTWTAEQTPTRWVFVHVFGDERNLIRIAVIYDLSDPQTVRVACLGDCHDRALLDVAADQYPKEYTVWTEVVMEQLRRHLTADQIKKGETHEWEIMGWTGKALNKKSSKD